MFHTELSSPNLLRSRQLADDSPVLSTPLMRWVPYSLLEMQASSIRQNITYMDRQLLKIAVPYCMPSKCLSYI